MDERRCAFRKEGLNNLVHDYLIAAMQVGNFMNYLAQDLLIVTPGDRSDIILASLTSHLSSTYPNIAGILLTGGIDLPESMQKLMEGWTGIPVPILSVKGATYDTCQELLKLHGKFPPKTIGRSPWRLTPSPKAWTRKPSSTRFSTSALIALPR